MPFNSNFDSPLQIVGANIEVKGSSAGLEGGELVSRSVAIKQDGTIVHGPANLALNWETVPALDAAGLHPGAALAIGTETYFLDLTAATFGTFSWSQDVELEEG
jgi:hypothetical protein